MCNKLPHSANSQLGQPLLTWQPCPSPASSQLPQPQQPADKTADQNAQLASLTIAPGGSAGSTRAESTAAASEYALQDMEEPIVNLEVSEPQAGQPGQLEPQPTQLVPAADSPNYVETVTMASCVFDGGPAANCNHAEQQPT